MRPPFLFASAKDARDDHHAAHARLPALAGAAGARRGGLSLWRGRREISRFRQRHRGQPARPRPPGADQGDPGAGRDPDPRLQPLRQPAGRGLCAAPLRPHLRRHRLPDQFGRRGGRMRDQDRAPLPPSSRPAREARADHLHQRLPRPHPRHDQRHQPGEDARRLRAAAARLHGRRVRRSRRGQGGDGPAHRRLPGRAGAGRGRHPPGQRRLHAGPARSSATSTT